MMVLNFIGLLVLAGLAVFSTKWRRVAVAALIAWLVLMLVQHLRSRSAAPLPFVHPNVCPDPKVNCTDPETLPDAGPH